MHLSPAAHPSWLPGTPATAGLLAAAGHSPGILSAAAACSTPANTCLVLLEVTDMSLLSSLVSMCYKVGLRGKLLVCVRKLD